MSNAAGSGGGPVMTPILLILFNFDTYHTVALSQTIIFGGSLVSIFLKFRLKHPTRKRPLIHYSLLSHIMSTLLLGISFGVMINSVTPPLAYLTLLVVLLTYTFYRTIKKAKKLYSEETVKKSELEANFCYQ